VVKRYKFASAWNGGDRFIEGRSYVLESDYDALVTLAYRASRDLYRGPPRNPDNDREAEITAKIDQIVMDSARPTARDTAAEPT
jgi:hypothetical protein